MTELEEWNDMLKNIQTAAPLVANKITCRAAWWPSSAVSALIYDTMSTNPGSKHMTRDEWGHSCFIIGLRSMIEEHDPDLYRLDIRFHKALSENRYETAKRIFRSIKAHKPDDGLIETIITVI